LAQYDHLDLVWRQVFQGGIYQFERRVNVITCILVFPYALYHGV
jgi:hypothetical protein